MRNNEAMRFNMTRSLCLYPARQPRNYRMKLLGNEILYSDLANWIKGLHALALELEDYTEKKSW